MIWNKEYEAMPRGELNNLQLERLQATVKRVYESVPMYKKRFDEAGIKPDIIKTLDDLSKLPFTVKTDLRDNYPFGLFAVPMTDIVRLHASSGTTGKSIVVGYTKKDIDTWSELMARTLSAAGTTADDVVHNAYGYGLPAMGTMLGQMTQVSTPTQGGLEMFPMIMMMSMMASMVGAA